MMTSQLVCPHPTWWINMHISIMHNCNKSITSMYGCMDITGVCMYVNNMTKLNISWFSINYFDLETILSSRDTTEYNVVPPSVPCPFCKLISQLAISLIGWLPAEMHSNRSSLPAKESQGKKTVLNLQYIFVHLFRMSVYNYVQIVKRVRRNITTTISLLSKHNSLVKWTAHNACFQV